MRKLLSISGTALPLLPDCFTQVILPPDDTISAPVSTHADMIFAYFDDTLFFHSSYYEKHHHIVDSIIAQSGKRLCITSDKRSKVYPEDVSLNALNIGDKLICKADSISCAMRNYSIINTRQGYAGCTALYAAGTVITADPSTLSACDANGIKSHKISGKDILLPGYDTGFIGGCCGVYGDTVYIYGEPTLSQSGRELTEFCEANGLSIVSVCNGPVTDIGGIRFI